MFWGKLKQVLKFTVAYINWFSTENRYGDEAAEKNRSGDEAAEKICPRAKTPRKTGPEAKLARIFWDKGRQIVKYRNTFFQNNVIQRRFVKGLFG